MRVIDASKTGILVLGYQGESQRVMVRLPLVDERNGRNVAEEFPGGQFSLSVTFPNRPGEYIVSPSDYQVTGNWIEWEVKAAYTQFFGEGNLQINYSGFDSTGMVKSKVWRITNKKSISTGAGTVPDWSDWKTELLSAAADVQSAVESYDAMTATAEGLPAGSTPTAEIDRSGENPVLRLGIPAGQGGGVTVDSELSNTSTNPVQNKVIAGALSSQSETIGNLNTEMNSVFAKVPKNLLDIYHPLVNKAFRSSGYIGTTEGSYVSNVINVEGLSKITVLLVDDTASADRRYSFSSSSGFENGTIVETDKLQIKSKKTLNVPVGAKYFAVDFSDSTHYAAMVSAGVQSQVQEGTEIVEHNAFGVQKYNLYPGTNVLGTENDPSAIQIVNPDAKDYIDEVNYTDGDYSYSNYSKYYTQARDYGRCDQPLPAIIKWNYQQNCSRQYMRFGPNQNFAYDHDGNRFFEIDPSVCKIAIYNLLPSTTYYYQVFASFADGTNKEIRSGSFTTGSDFLRMLKIDGVAHNAICGQYLTSGIANVRDIGGWPTTLSGYTKIKYGKVIRGSELVGSSCIISEKGKWEAVGDLNIRCDIDLRSSNEGGQTEGSPLGDLVEYVSKPVVSYASAFTNNVQALHDIFETIMENVSNGITSYIHCKGGNDRTATVVFLLSGILGVSENNLSKDYELSSLCGWYIRNRNSNTYDYKGMVSYISALTGNTLTDKFETYFIDTLGFTAEEIATFRADMLDT